MNGVEIFDLSGKRAIITGAAGRLGRSLAQGLYGFGAELILMDIDYSEVRKLSEEMGYYTLTADGQQHRDNLAVI